MMLAACAPEQVREGEDTFASTRDARATRNQEVQRDIRWPSATNKKMPDRASLAIRH